MDQPTELSAADAQKLVCRLALDSRNIVFSEHAEEMMGERNITTTHILNTLRRGSIVEGPYVSDQGDWRMNFRYVTAGMAMVVTVAIDWPNQRLIIVTVYERNR